MKSVATMLEVDQGRLARDRQSIDQSWVYLQLAVDNGQLTESQMGWILDREPDDIDDDPPALVVSVWAAQLRRYAHDPRAVSADPDSVAWRTCNCEDGWLYPEDDAGVPRAQPCPRCNSRQRQRWAACWRDPNHSCPECTGPARRRTLADESRAEKNDHTQEELDGLV